MTEPDHIRDEPMTIGVFTRHSRLSLKALRLYDEMGLLTPRHVDPRTGYRYYADDQIERARLIGHLRQLEMALHDISTVIDLPPERAVGEIVAFWQAVETDMNDKRRLVEYLTSRLSNQGGDMYTVATRTVPEQTVISQQRNVLAGDLPGFIAAAMTDLFSLAGPDAKGAPFVVYHGQVNMDSDGPVEVCVPVADAKAQYESATVRVEPAHREAYARISKRQVEFPQILEAYEAVETWAKNEDVAITDSPREVYFVDWDTVGDDEPACDISFPIED